MWRNVVFYRIILGICGLLCMQELILFLNHSDMRFAWYVFTYKTKMFLWMFLTYNYVQLSTRKNIWRMVTMSSLSLYLYNKSLCITTAVSIKRIFKNASEHDHFYLSSNIQGSSWCVSQCLTSFVKYLDACSIILVRKLKNWICPSWCGV